jgi:hypothetical protein
VAIPVRTFKNLPPFFAQMVVILFSHGKDEKLVVLVFIGI